MYLSDLLAKHELDPRLVLVLRHRPHEPKLRKVLPWLAAEQPDVFNAYQQTQGAKLESSMKDLIGSGVVASFIGHEPGKALFVGLFVESYHNTPDVDIRARVLLQTAAFEVLLELPERQQRKVFKDRIEQHCATTGERRLAYKFEVSGGKKPESRTLKGIWADRFYTLRNHIIHGQKVRGAEYLFRRKQHHVVIAPVFFIHTLRRLIGHAMAESREPIKFYSRVTWHEPPPDADDPEDEDQGVGFRAVTDHYARMADQLVATGYV